MIKIRYVVQEVADFTKEALVLWFDAAVKFTPEVCPTLQDQHPTTCSVKCPSAGYFGGGISVEAPTMGIPLSFFLEATVGSPTSERPESE
jgi:hypothetical protein